MLQDELSRQGANASAVWIEARLDKMEELAERGTRGVTRKALGKIVSDTARMVRRGVPEDPMCIDPPSCARYQVEGPGLYWLDVELAADAESWLSQVYSAATRRVGDMALLKVWMEWCQESSSERRRIAVAIGSRRVGVLGRGGAEAVSGALTSAAERDELPWAQGRLTRRERAPVYVLEVRAGADDE